MRITWDDPSKRLYHQGLDRGVIYVDDKEPVPWNGLTSVDEGGDSTSELLYRDGLVYLADVDPGDHKTSISAIMYPDSFGECIGVPKVTDGFFVDNQKAKRFHLSYRTLVGSGTEGDLFGHQIHLVYNCMAELKPRKRQTIGDGTNLTTFDFDVICTPVQLEGYRPSAHYTIDTRGLSPSTIQALEEMLYGSNTVDGRMPDPQEIFDILNFGDALTVVLHSDGTFSITGSESNVIQNSPWDWTVHNINSTAPASDGSYVISTGGSTTVITD